MRILILSCAGMLWLASCAYDEPVIEDYTTELAGTYEVDYVGKNIAALDLFVEVEAVDEDEVLIIPPDSSKHTQFQVKLVKLSGGDFAFKVGPQSSGDYYVYGVNSNSSKYDGGFQPDDQSFFYQVIYERFSVLDTATVIGSFKTN